MAGLGFIGGGGSGSNTGFVAVEATVAAFPAAADNTNKIAYLYAEDGTNFPGIYLSNGTDWEFQDDALIRGIVDISTDTTVNSTHSFKLFRNAGGSSLNITLPSDATDNLPIGFQTGAFYTSTGILTFDDDGGSTTIISDGSLTSIDGSGVIATAIKIESDTWIVSGKLV